MESVDGGSNAKARSGVLSAAKYVAPIVVNTHPMLHCTPPPCTDPAIELLTSRRSRSATTGAAPSAFSISTCQAGARRRVRASPTGSSRDSTRRCRSAATTRPGVKFNAEHPGRAPRSDRPRQRSLPGLRHASSDGPERRVRSSAGSDSSQATSAHGNEGNDLRLLHARSSGTAFQAQAGQQSNSARTPFSSSNSQHETRKRGAMTYRVRNIVVAVALALVAALMTLLRHQLQEERPGRRGDRQGLGRLPEHPGGHLRAPRSSTVAHDGPGRRPQERRPGRSPTRPDRGHRRDPGGLRRRAGDDAPVQAAPTQWRSRAELTGALRRGPGSGRQAPASRRCRQGRRPRRRRLEHLEVPRERSEPPINRRPQRHVVVKGAEADVATGGPRDRLPAGSLSVPLAVTDAQAHKLYFVAEERRLVAALRSAGPSTTDSPERSRDGGRRCSGTASAEAGSSVFGIEGSTE